MGDLIYRLGSNNKVISSHQPSARLGRVSALLPQSANYAHHRSFIFVYWTWNLSYAPFKQLGSDTILTVAPGGITFFTCSPEIIAQIGRRHKEFLKPTRLYKIVDV